MRKKLLLILLISVIALYVMRIYRYHKVGRYKYRITSKNRIGVTDTFSKYGDSIGWYNTNGTHVFFPKKSKITKINKN